MGERAVTLSVHCLDREGMLADITAALSEQHIPLREVVARQSKRGRGTILVTVVVRDFMELDPIVERLRQVPNVTLVEHGSQTE